jgi:hypothetical protein
MTLCPWHGATPTATPLLVSSPRSSASASDAASHSSATRSRLPKSMADPGGALAVPLLLVVLFCSDASSFFAPAVAVLSFSLGPSLPKAWLLWQVYFHLFMLILALTLKIPAPWVEGITLNHNFVTHCLSLQLFSLSLTLPLTPRRCSFSLWLFCGSFSYLRLLLLTPAQIWSSRSRSRWCAAYSSLMQSN